MVIRTGSAEGEDAAAGAACGEYTPREQAHDIANKTVSHNRIEIAAIEVAGINVGMVRGRFMKSLLPAYLSNTSDIDILGASVLRPAPGRRN